MRIYALHKVSIVFVLGFQCTVLLTTLHAYFKEEIQMQNLPYHTWHACKYDRAVQNAEKELTI